MKDVISEIKIHLKQSMYVAFIAGLWTYNYRRKSYLSLTCRYTVFPTIGSWQIVLWGATNSNQIKNGKNIKEILVISLVIKKRK